MDNWDKNMQKLKQVEVKKIKEALKSPQVVESLMGLQEYVGKHKELYDAEERIKEAQGMIKWWKYVLEEEESLLKELQGGK